MSLAACLFAFLALLGAGPQETDVPEHLRRSIERHAVALRVVGEDGEKHGYGSGVLLSQENSLLYVLTARHVVLPPGEEQPHGRVQLLLGGAWRDAGPRVTTLGELDAALVAISVHEAGIDRTTLFDELRAAPRASLTRGTPVWAYGWDVDELGLTWRGGSVLERTDDAVRFQSKGVKPGYSGCGVFTKAGEYVGLLVDEGSGGDFRALSFERVFESVRAAGLSVGIETDPIEAALAHSLREGLVLGLCTRIEKQRVQYRWTAIRLADSDQAGYRGWTLGTQALGDCLLAVEAGGGLTLTAEKGAGRPTWVRDFRRSDELALEGFVVLEGRVQGALATLVIPSGRGELLAALATANRGDFEKGTLGLSADEGRQLHLEGNVPMVSFEGARFRLPLDLPNGGDGPTLVLPDRVRILGGRLRAELLLSDGGAEARDRKDLLGSCIVELRTGGGGEPVELALRVDAGRRQAVVLELPPGARTLSWSMGKRPQAARVVLENAVVESAE